MLSSGLCRHSDAYILANGTIAIPPAPATNPDNNNKGLVFKNWDILTDFISEINNTQIDNAKNIGVVMSMHNLIDYSDNCSKTSGSLRQYYQNEPFQMLMVIFLIFLLLITTVLRLNLNKKQKTTAATADSSRKDVAIMVTLEYLSNFWRTAEMVLINSKINLILACSDTCVLPNNAKATTLAITDTKLYVPIVTSST